MSEPPATQRIRVWDWPTRVFHWLLVVLIPFAWWAYKADRMQWHRIAGYAVLALLAFRFFWGFFGSETARFANFVHGPAGVWRYVTALAKTTIGHNPLGAWSVVALLALLSAQAALGLFAADDEGLESGPFAGTMAFDQAQRAAHWHGILFNALLGLIALHLLAILFYFLRGDNLVGAMISGTRLMPDGERAPRQASFVAFIVGILIAGGVFAGLMWIDGA